jgi:hypothetical protein
MTWAGVERQARNQRQIGAKTIEHIKATVDQLRNELLAAMDETTRDWVSGWLNEDVVPPSAPLP